MRFTLVLGIDQGHLEHFRLVWPNWMRHKPNLKRYDLVAFSDDKEVLDVVHHLVSNHPSDVNLVEWNPDTEYVSDGTRWTDPQRQKMLAGFVHIAAGFVRTPYWLKLDLDVVTTGKDDWIDLNWFELVNPAIIAHRWGYTKPANQMLDLDKWANENQNKWGGLFRNTNPLNLRPHHTTSAGVGHKRIISWCGFFRSDFTRLCSKFAIDSVGEGQLPVPSQDGYMWYVAKRLGFPIVRVNMKSLGWRHCSRLSQLQTAIGGVDANS